MLTVRTGDFKVYGSCILYLILQSAVLMLVLVWYDSGWTPAFLARTKHRNADLEQIDDTDSEVFEEAKRVDGATDQLRVKHVTKAFGPFVAVQNVSFGIPHGETFALLGPNGAGKSTTINLIRGDVRPSEKDSDILIEDISIIEKRAAARTHLGVCPQFDAMDQMTAIEHLRFYARARGVQDVEHNVDQIIHAVGLAPFKNRMAGKLSGGNKRKLSLGIALTGNPSVLILDEPSSGMDAASKRVMWRTLSAVSAGRSLLLTTHSMEEADALADRAAVMAKRMLAVGTADELRKKHGDAYHVHCVHKDAPYSSEHDMAEIKSFIHRTFPGAITEERSFHGQIRFSVPGDRTAAAAHGGEDEISLDQDEKLHIIDDKKEILTTVSPAVASAHHHSSSSDSSPSSSSNSISALFSHLEAHKAPLGLEYYSVSQATLDQVFLSIVVKHNVLEENYAKFHDAEQLQQQQRGGGAGMAWRKMKRVMATVYHNA